MDRSPITHKSLTDHIMVFSDALSRADCDELIARFESSSDQQVTSQQDGGHSFVKIDVTEHWPDQHKALIPIFLSHFNRYQQSTKARFWPPRFSFEHIQLKRYLPNGRDSFPEHVDVTTHAAARRFMTAFIYLNETTGGETVFPELDISVAPESGKLIAFPPLWMFPHAGLPPRSTPKYILHTYLCYPA
jgi:prolyl 4-hydroxylase